ncbi:hypothetical protein [Streptoalloteichus hindustanus]|uniref:Uncharacterized protein n=1 Tax=Streptoalloteichus hindustanus TaxID=2017 RepID=A0A1M5I9L9_STRHI|nr:hypothetical protein [Streptoalloteichus hindustanus]SHG24819.1 hypothetical protein SAMN05444320_107173 [Streptoalloteichus hindustanus]
MRVHAAYQKDGRIVAIAEIVEDGDERLAVRLLPDDEHEVVEVEVPREFDDKPFAELVERFRVRSGPEGPTLTPR